MKKFISSILIVIMLFVGYSFTVKAEVTIFDWDINSTGYINTLEKIKSQGYSEKVKLKDGTSLPFNYGIYIDPFYSNKIIFGTPKSVPENEVKYSSTTSRQEWQYLGYNRFGKKVLNKKYPDDSTGSGAKTWIVTTGTFVTENEAMDSWRDLLRLGTDVVELNKKIPLIGYGIRESDNLGAWYFGDKSNRDNTEYMRKCRIETSTGLFSGGTISIEHTNPNGSKWYATFDCVALGTQSDLGSELFVNGKQADSEILTFKDNKATMDINLSVKGRLQPKQYTDIYTNTLVKKFDTKLLKYQIKDENKKVIKEDTINKIGKYRKTLGDSASLVDYRLELERSIFNKTGMYQLVVTWGHDFESVMGEKLPSEQTSIINIEIQEDMTPPVAQIDTTTELYVGERVLIKGFGKDKEDSAEELTYRWIAEDTKLRQALKTECEQGYVGGWHSFDKAGEYELELQVINTRGIKNIIPAKVTFVVKEKGDVILNLNANNSPKTVEYLNGYNEHEVTVIASGNIKVPENYNRKIIRQGILCVAAPKSYGGSGNISLAGAEQKILEGNKTSMDSNFKFNIDTEGKEYTQYFKVMYMVEFEGGSKEFKEKLLTTDFRKKIVLPEPTINNPPFCKIIAPSVVALNEDFKISSRAMDPDGDELEYTWSISPESFDGYIGDNDGMLKFSEVKTYTATLTVTDPKGLSATDTKQINVRVPSPSANIGQYGTLKENRRVTLTGKGSQSGSYNTRITSYKWEIRNYPVGATAEDVKCVEDFSSEELNMLFKKKGTYIMELTVTNNLGYTSTIGKDITIEEDIAPVAQMISPDRIFRSADDLSPKGLSQATFNLKSSSYSIDGDDIKKIAWIIIFDSDNDDDYEEETCYIYDLDFTGSQQMPNNDSLNTHFRPIGKYKDIHSIDISKINTGNLQEMQFKSTHVGKYAFGVIAQEEFGQPTIQQFITEQDKRKENSFE